MAGGLTPGFGVFVPPVVADYGGGVAAAIGAGVHCLWLSTLQESCKLEKRADQTAVAAKGLSGVYAAALEKLYRFNHVPAALKKGLRSHPDLYDRMLAAGVTPDYPRPLPPKLPHSITLAGGVLGILIAVWLTQRIHAAAVGT